MSRIWLHMVAGAAAFTVIALPVHADALWCGVVDQPGQRAFRSDLLIRESISKSEAWRYSERFIEAINGRYATRLPVRDDSCRVFASTERGRAALALWRNNAERRGTKPVLQGVF